MELKQRVNDSQKFVSYIGSSMNPTLKPGDELLVVPYEDRKVRRGDVVVFFSPRDHQKVTHRVISIEPNGVRTQGDNNNKIDPMVLNPDDIIGRVVSTRRRGKLLSVHGGKRGRLFACLIRTSHKIDSGIFFLVRPVYYWLARSGILKRLTFIQKQIRTISFIRPVGTEVQLIIGQKVIGRLFPGKDRWQIKRPFHLFIDEESLPRKEQNRPAPSESEVFRGDKTINKKNRNHFDLTEQIRDTHKELTMCGEPRNALLDFPNELVIYISSLLRNEALPLPELPLNQWSEVLSCLRSHWILPLLYRQISFLPLEYHPPEKVKDKMRKSFLISRVRCFHMEKQLDEIIKAFHNEDVQILVLKGPSLALSVYPDPALRPSSDLDLLVLPEQMSQARAILGKLGYQNLGKRFEHSRDFYSEETFLHRKNARDNRAIELHWDLHSFSGISREVKVEELFHRAVKIDKKGLTFKTLHPIDALIHRALNMAIWHNKDIRLIWIYDTALLAQGLKASKDWGVVLKRSVDWRARLALEYSLKMAQVWVGLKLPEKYNDFSRWPPPTATEAGFWSDALLRHDRLTSFLKLHWSDTTGVFKKSKFLLHLLFPSPRIIRLDYPPAHNWLLPFSYARRLYRWFKQYFVSRFGLSNRRG
ncbi:MAG: signal peptidase I [Candidatus Aminicenantes bacterium]|nr:signal peptidase I [Candidatus Aminicenantes bacterium]